MRYFSRDTFRFFTELAADNHRDWFQANRERYERDVREPFRRFIRDLSPGLQAISPHYRGDDRLQGGSLFRINRDVRFSRDKRPYKTWAGARFWHSEAGRGNSPVFYLHLAPGEVFMGAGLWRPPGPMLRRLRSFLHHNPNSWLEIFAGESFAATFRPAGESLTRMPRGYEADDPVARDLRRKDFVVSSPLSEAEACGEAFLERYLQRCRLAAPYMDYLCAALDLEF